MFFGYFLSFQISNAFFLSFTFSFLVRQLETVTLDNSMAKVIKLEHKMGDRARGELGCQFIYTFHTKACCHMRLL